MSEEADEAEQAEKQKEEAAESFFPRVRQARCERLRSQAEGLVSDFELLREVWRIRLRATAFRQGAGGDE